MYIYINFYFFYKYLFFFKYLLKIKYIPIIPNIHLKYFGIIIDFKIYFIKYFNG